MSESEWRGLVRHSLDQSARKYPEFGRTRGNPYGGDFRDGIIVQNAMSRVVREDLRDCFERIMFERIMVEFKGQNPVDDAARVLRHTRSTVVTRMMRGSSPIALEDLATLALSRGLRLSIRLETLQGDRP